VATLLGFDAKFRVAMLGCGGKVVGFDGNRMSL